MDLPSPKMIRLETGDASFLFSEKTGSLPIILLHGGGLDQASLSWRHLFPLLAQTNTVIAPNWPGYVGSAAFDGPYGISDLGRWLLDLMNNLDIERADMVGISMGGGAALWAALNAPERIRRLVPVGTYGVQQYAPYHWLSYILLQLPVNAISYGLMRQSRWLTQQMLKAIFADPDRIDDDLIDEVMAAMKAHDTSDSFSNFQRAEIAPDRLRTVFIDSIHNISHPTLFIHGRHDSLVPLDAVEQAAKQMPDAKVEVLETGHWPMRERPDLFNPLVERFLRD
ncbi:MAG: alpha/beta fold hydrolase [Pseudomonadota bacterium]